jgi:hypothetical protein
MELNKEQNIDLLTRDSDSKDRINKQSVLALLGSLILSITLWNTGWQDSSLLVALIGLSLLVTPGLAIDGLVYGAMKRPVGSTFGNTVIAGAAWYAGIISLGFTLGYAFDVNSIAGLTLVFSLISVMITMFAGGLKVSQLVSKNDFKYLATFTMSLVLLSSVVAGAGYIFINKNVLQPTGTLDSMSLSKVEAFAKDSPYVLNGAMGSIDLNMVSTEVSNDLTVEFTSETGAKNSIFTTVSGFDNVVKVKTPTVSGCGYINITNKTTGQVINNLYVKDYASTECSAVVASDIFERFDIDLSGAPTDSLKDLLKFAEEQLVKGNLDKLPQAYKDCIKQEDAALVMECIDNV